MTTTNWMADANCRNHPPEFFIPNRPTKKQTEQAIQICNTCSVIDQCRIYAQQIHQLGELDGIFAATTKQQRRTMWGKPPVEPPHRPQTHGTLYSYRKLKCRCENCRSAHAETVRRQRAQRKAKP